MYSFFGKLHLVLKSINLHLMQYNSFSQEWCLQ
jgi:hypothetical protein